MADQIDLIASSMASLTESFRAVAHNLANLNTAGYKRLGSSFAQILQAGMGDAVEGKTTIDFRQGSLVHTGRPRDLALKGKGFFVIETPEGRLYTRNGTFCANPNGQLVDTLGRTVAGEGGPIQIPRTVSPADVQVASDGSIRAGGTRIGKLRLVAFDDPSALAPAGGSCYRPTEPVEPKPAPDATVHQGYQEGSNVSAIKELVHLITITRLYQSNAKSIEAQDDRIKSLLDVAMGS